MLQKIVVPMFTYLPQKVFVTIFFCRPMRLVKLIAVFGAYTYHWSAILSFKYDTDVVCQQNLVKTLLFSVEHSSF